MRIRWSVCVLLLCGCATHPQSTVMIEPDPVTGEATAYNTVFLAADGTRLVLSGPVGAPAPVAVTLWLRSDAIDGSCDGPTMTVGDHVVRPDVAEARVLDTPSGSDQTVAFEVPPSALRAVVTKAGKVSACGRSWVFDEPDRAAIKDFLDALASTAPG